MRSFVILADARIQNVLKILDPGVRRDDARNGFETFYEAIKIDELQRVQSSPSPQSEGEGWDEGQVPDMIVGVISDTHGRISDQALKALQGVDHILHAGDVGGQKVIKMLEKIASVTAVRGNMDGHPWGNTLSPFEMITLDQVCYYIIHNLHGIDLDPKSAGIQVVVSGHTHTPEIKTHDDVIYFNPGSASSSRHGGPLTIGRVHSFDSRIQPEIIQLPF